MGKTLDKEGAMEDWDERPQLNLVKATILALMVSLVITHPLFVKLTGVDVTEFSILNRARAEEVIVETKELKDSEQALKTGYYFDALPSFDKAIYLIILEWINGVSDKDLVLNGESHPNPGDFYESMIKIYRMVLLDNPHYQPEVQVLQYKPSVEVFSFGISQVTISPFEQDENVIENYYDAILDEVSRINNETLAYSDFQKVQHFYKYLVENITYLDGEDYIVHTPVGVFIEQEAVCDGIARAFKMLCDYAEIPCMVVVTDEHAWNVVELNGAIYHFDATWDLGKENWRFFMLSYEELMLIDPDKHKLTYEGYDQFKIYFENIEGNVNQ